MHLVHTKHARVLLDCGLYQGRRNESFQRNKNLPIDAKAVDVAVLSHAHIDHSGSLPSLYRNGFRGRVFATPATRDLCSAMLKDAALIQAHDAKYINKQIMKGAIPGPPIEPIYEEEDVLKVLRNMIGVPYRQRLRIADGVDVTFYDAGHVLGSAIVALDVEEDGKTERVVFTGDLGRRRTPILRDPEIPPDANFLITESTYGDRFHTPIEKMDDELAEVVKRTYERGGKLLIPSFALERAQEVIFAMKRLQQQGRLPKIPVYVDSPLTVKITDVFRMHPDCYDDEARKMIDENNSPFDFEGLRYIDSVEDSKAIDASTTPSITISASGMCEAGRVLHHLRSNLGGKDHTVLIVGYQAQHTLGRRLVERRSRVRIFGVEQERRCEVKVLNGFSAHADQDDLVQFASEVREQGDLTDVALVHGEPKSLKTLYERMTEENFSSVHRPMPGDRV